MARLQARRNGKDVVLEFARALWDKNPETMRPLLTAITTAPLAERVRIARENFCLSQFTRHVAASRVEGATVYRLRAPDAEAARCGEGDPRSAAD
jgi:hypothetical protein